MLIKQVHAVYTVMATPILDLFFNYLHMLEYNKNSKLLSSEYYLNPLASLSSFKIIKRYLDEFKPYYWLLAEQLREY